MITDIPPHKDNLDFHGGILGAEKDCTLEGRIPIDEGYVKAFEFLERLGKSQGYIPLDYNLKDESKSYIRKVTDDYCKTYLN